MRFTTTIATLCLLGSIIGPLQAQQSSDTLAIQSAAIAAIEPARLAADGRRLVFDAVVRGRTRPAAESRALREEFKLAAATAAESGRCSQDLRCSGIPARTVIIDVSTPVIRGDSATTVVRAVWSAIKANGAIGTGGSLHQLQLVRRLGAWVVVSGKVKTAM